MIAGATSPYRRHAGVVLTLALGLALWAGVSGAAAPAGRYTIATTGAIAGGTVYDTVTGLTWQRTVPNQNYASDGAKAYCNGLGAGWRVPSVKELQTIVDETLAPNALHIDTSAFQNVPTSENFFWSSTPVAGSATDGWVFGFSGCASGTCHLAKTTAYKILCVK